MHTNKFEIIGAVGANHEAGIISVLFGSLVGGIRNIMKNGWHGWLKFLLNWIVNMFVGILAYLLAVEWGLPGLWPVIIALTFGSLGEKGWEIILNQVFDYIEFKTKQK